MSEPGDIAEKGDIAALVLAAGASRRFGSDKLLHPCRVNGVMLALAAHSLAPWLQVFERVSVVTRPGAEHFRAAIDKAVGSERAQRIEWISCEEAAEGMAASIRCGVRANMQAAGWLIGLADMPAVPDIAVMQVRAALHAGASIAAPEHAGRLGHPVGFAGVWRNALLSLHGDAGARSLLQAHAAAVSLQPVADAGILHDVDRPEDLPESSLAELAAR